MYLAEHLELGEETFPLCGVLPFSTRMPAPLKIAYVEVKTTGGLFGQGRTARGHLFHHSEISGEPTGNRCYQVLTSRGDESEEGHSVGNVLASYAHLHFASEPSLASAFVQRCQESLASMS
jgi:cobyrinic acid a,c-diamide synthase